MKSAMPSPVFDPLKLNAPLVGRLFEVSIFVLMRLTPNDT